MMSLEARRPLVEAHQRVMAISALQRQLSEGGYDHVAFSDYIATLCSLIGEAITAIDSEVAITTMVDGSIVTADFATDVGMLVTELIINAVKHAFPAAHQPSGSISVTYASDGSKWTLTVQDDGVGVVTAADVKRPGLGTRIVDAIAGKLGASVRSVHTDTGTRIVVSNDISSV